ERVRRALRRSWLARDEPPSCRAGRPLRREAGVRILPAPALRRGARARAGPVAPRPATGRPVRGTSPARDGEQRGSLLTHAPPHVDRWRLSPLRLRAGRHPRTTPFAESPPLRAAPQAA